MENTTKKEFQKTLVIYKTQKDGTVYCYLEANTAKALGHMHDDYTKECYDISAAITRLLKKAAKQGLEIVFA